MADDPRAHDLSAEQIAASLAARVRDIVSDAEASAQRVRREVEAEIARQAAADRAAAEEDARRIRREAEAEAERYLAESRRRADAFAGGRIQRLQQLSGALEERAEAIVGQLDAAEEVRRRLDDLLRAIARAIEETAAEATRPTVRLPPLGGPPDRPRDI